MDPVRMALAAGWIGLLAGALSGLGLGLRFHDAEWLGGYGSFRRRLLRLGHIAFFGLGFVNLLFAFSALAIPIAAPFAKVAAIALLTGALTMPLACFLSAWREPFRHLFAVPVVSVVIGIAAVLAGWGLA